MLVWNIPGGTFFHCNSTRQLYLLNTGETFVIDIQRREAEHTIRSALGKGKPDEGIKDGW